MGFSLSGGSEGLMREIGNRPWMAVPPTPPAKDLPKRPAPLKLDPPTFTSSPSLPPNRPLPPRPTARPSETPRVPPPTRRPPLRPQGPLSMNPPTRPGTAASQGTASQASAPATIVRFPGSTKRLSWTSIASRRPTKFGQGKFGRVELVPQPSDDPDDPLVCPTPDTRLEMVLMARRTGPCGGKSSTFGLS